ncbi:universal stress protein [Pelotomaculum propionicicum]|uniref:TRAP-T-associated universal stress protein TeaD n=1 Tax=Pelotomaculum propionicicum TaxID=258475 RepID=A0A4Y7RQD8_9FIRM|nr:universal stress protein [Pelotomaculum propionicicum]NLI12423.1 universal stress protein [Peptococcaceae bacterium]TEB10960.1 TRAP-T-associated universal stress protein TeaD [Pelotomaculum propionicicum]
MYKKALIALDGSAPSFRAVEAAIKMTGSIGEISLIYVVNLPHVNAPADGQIMDFFPPQYYKELTKTAQEVLDKAEQMLAPYHKTTKIIESGPPAETILHIAEKDHYDLIIMGSRGLNSIQKLFLGSVSNKVLSLAQPAVLLVK